MLFNLRFHRIFLLIASLILLIIRIIGDVVFFSLDNSQTLFIIIWKVITGLLISTAIFFYLFSKVEKEIEKENELSSEDFITNLFYIIIILIGLNVCNFIIPSSISQTGAPQNYLMLILVDDINFFSIIASFFVLKFLYRWIMFRRTKKTKTHIKILVFGLVYFILVDMIPHLVSFLKPSDFSKFFLILFAILVFITVSRNSWIALLPRKLKIRMLFLTLLGIVFSLLIFITTVNDDTKYYYANIYFMPGISSLMSTTFLYLCIYCLRLFFATIGSLPTSDIVERRSSELSSLTYLNRIVSETTEISNLIDTVTRLAFDASEASAAWTEFYGKNGEVNIISSQILNKNHIEKIHSNPNLKNILFNLQKPLIVESLPENNELSYIAGYINIARALIAVPLFSGEEKIGSLVVIHAQEFGFEKDDEKVLSAFSHNVSIALENARLLKDSIEKERYKRELLLARQMQKKLLPQSLPAIIDYSISAYTEPAEEVGGDFYDFVFLKNGKPCILIGDVSGKGITAAFYMAQLKGVVLSIAPDSTSASDLLKKVNSTLYGSMEKQMYITLSCIVLDKDEEKLHLARAGHMPSIFNINGNISMVTPKGLGIGLVNGTKFSDSLEEITVDFKEKDICFLFTDGINELVNSNNEEFGYKPLQQIISDSLDIEAEEINARIRNSIKEHLGDCVQHDDITFVTIVCR